MTREQVLMILGALVLISPWSGIPLQWLEWVLSVIGLMVIGIGLTLRMRNRAAPPSLEPPEQREPESRSSHIAFS